MCALLLFALRPEYVIVYVITFVCVLSTPVQVPVPVVVLGVGRSFAPLRVATYVMVLGCVVLLPPQAVRTPTPSSAVASVNACFCIGTLPRLRWGSEEQIVSSGMRPRCSSGHPDVSALFRRSSSRHHGA